jgi:hypothetical protein
MQLAEYLLRTVLSWTSLTTPQIEPYTSALASSGASSTEALALVSLAKVEGGWLPFVLDHRCNDPAWRARQRGWMRGACDAGLARGPFQLHGAEGMTPAEEVKLALYLFRHGDQNWSRWREGRDQAAWWRAKHPLP